MAEDWSTIDARRSAREIEILRQRYRSHREALSKLNTDAPSEHLANEYARLMSDIERSVEKLNELDHVSPMVAVADQTHVYEPHEIPQVNTAGDRILASGPTAPMPAADDPSFRPTVTTRMESGSGSRIAFIAVAAVAVLALLYFLVTRAGGTKKLDHVEETHTATLATPIPDAVPVRAAPAPVATLSMKPAENDYGTIRRGTRAVRQFDVVNNSEAPITITVARSKCRCLFYEYKAIVPAKGKSTVTVALDGSRVKAGPLDETVDVASKSDLATATSFAVKAVIK